MSLTKEEIHRLCDLELAIRGKSAAISNSVFAIFIFIYHFGLLDLKIPVKSLAVFMLVVNILRYYLSHLHENKPAKSIHILKLIIILNSLTLAGISGLALWELDLSGVDFAILGCVVAGMTAGSIISLSYDRVLFLIHSGTILGTLTVLSLVRHARGDGSEGVNLAFIIMAYFIYLYAQFRNFNKQTLQKFSYQKELEKSYEDIKNSTEKLIQASRFAALGDMAQGLAHEFNNSTMVILGSAQQVERELKKESILSEKNEKRIRGIVETIQRMKTVIDGLKFFSQDMNREDKIPTPLSQIIERTLHYSQEMLRAHDVKLYCSQFSETIIHCQPIQITHILFNLLKNADEAVQGLSDKERWIELLISEEDGSVYFKVVNGGKPIPPENRGRLFEPLYSTKGFSSGLGLSLSSARGLARDHGGEIYLEEDQEYTTFTLKLPLK